MREADALEAARALLAEAAEHTAPEATAASFWRNAEPLLAALVAELEAARAVVEKSERHMEARERFYSFNGNAAGWAAQDLSDAVDRTAEQLRAAISAAKAGKAVE